MTRAKLVLERCLAADREIQELEDSYQLELDVATSVGQRLTDTGDRHPVGTHNERVANTAVELAGKGGAIEARRARKRAEVIAVAKLLKRLPPVYGRLINLYYIGHAQIGTIAREMHYSYGYVRNLKADAVARLCEVPDCEVEVLMPDGYDWALTERERATLDTVDEQTDPRT